MTTQTFERIMTYEADMEIIDSNIMDTVLESVAHYDYHQYNDHDVRQALHKDYLDIHDFACLLSPTAAKFLEPMALKAKSLRQKYFGNGVSLFTPLYIANYCENHCVYCGFNCFNKIKRGKLTMDEIDLELQTIAQTGLKEILFLTGESKSMSSVEYIGEAIKLAKKYFTTIGIEIYPLNTDEYRYLHECGADFVSVYQETYHLETYDQNHLRGPKSIFPYRFNAQERALNAGLRGVAFGSLLGLSDFRKDAFATGLHAHLIQQSYPEAEISFSTPRIRPYINNACINPNDVHEKELLQVILAYRLFLPYAGITISTRERAGFRDNVVPLACTKISAGVNVGVGGHEVESKGDEQFDINDNRSVLEIADAMKQLNCQPIYKDHIFL